MLMGSPTFPTSEAVAAAMNSPTHQRDGQAFDPSVLLLQFRRISSTGYQKQKQTFLLLGRLFNEQFISRWTIIF